MSGPGFVLGIIGGGGWLGHAVARAVVEAGLLGPGSLILSSRSPGRARATLPEARWTDDNQALVEASDIVVVSVRPAQFGGVRVDMRGKTAVSLMAGVSSPVLVERLGTSQVVRAMPNAAAEIRRSYTPWFAAPSVPQQDRDRVGALFACCGAADEVPSEAHIDYLTGLTGSGPAFPALLADAMVRDAVERGLDPALARRAVVAVVAGASQLLEGPTAPSEVVDAFVEYRGTTAAAIGAMLGGGFRDAVRAGLRAAEARTSSMAAE